MFSARQRRRVPTLLSVLVGLRLISGVPYAVAPSVLHKRSEPLLLTPYIRANQAGTARRLALIKDLPGASPVLNDLIRSYSGYVTVNEACQSNIFFWFFPKPIEQAKGGGTQAPLRPNVPASPSNNAISNNDGANSSVERPSGGDLLNKTAPLLLWMQGGPGASSLFGLFVETGPFQVNMDLTLSLRKSSWLQHASLLYVDNPVGSGFSYTMDDACYPGNQRAIGDDLVEFVRQFYLLFPELVSTPFYVGGQSYAGEIPS
ncbi:venom serine carboxypeptidase-like [Tropilaelaps mercedesae]|uniref:Venom serine carboxypeptidase-like n=1 Tax=Tropilaelaps mercedesae TaxID=418985 RepID=A0A1V9XR25_9ACAR|nr:venom serine carboxypeptidase-like [Tropilaelaps mercedesae]